MGGSGSFWLVDEVVVGAVGAVYVYIAAVVREDRGRDYVYKLRSNCSSSNESKRSSSLLKSGRLIGL